MIIIIIGLIVLLVIGAVVVGTIQQQKAKQETEKREKSAKFKAIIDESEDLISNLNHLPSNGTLLTILQKRSLNAVKSMLQISPSSKPMKEKAAELEGLLKASQNNKSNSASDEGFNLPDNEQQLVVILQTIKKLRAMLRSEKTKGVLEASVYSAQDSFLDTLQLKIGIESIVSRGKKAHSKDMLGSARQYYEKALQTLSSHPNQSEYTKTRKAEVEDQLEGILKALKTTNAEDAAKKAKDEEDDLDMLFQPKKKW